MADREKKRGRWKYKKLNISRTKTFSDAIKSIFIVFEGLSFDEKIKNDGHKLLMAITFIFTPRHYGVQWSQSYLRGRRPQQPWLAILLVMVSQ